MKRSLFLIICVMMCVLLGACGKEEEDGELIALRRENADLKNQLSVQQGEIELLKRRVEGADNAVSKNSGRSRKVTEREDTDIRNVKFGDSLEEVEKSESAESLGEASADNMLSYRETVLGMDMAVTYLFNDDDQMYQCTYLLNEIYNDWNVYIYNFDKIIGELEKKYGEETDKAINTNYLYASANDDGEALMVGALSKQYIWDLDNMTIYATLNNGGGELVFGISYVSKEIPEPEQTSSL